MFLGSGCFAPLPLVVWRALLILGSTQGIARQASPGSQYSQFAIPGIEPKILLVYKKNTEHWSATQGLVISKLPGAAHSAQFTSHNSKFFANAGSTQLIAE